MGDSGNLCQASPETLPIGEQWPAKYIYSFTKQFRIRKYDIYDIYTMTPPKHTVYGHSNGKYQKLYEALYSISIKSPYIYVCLSLYYNYLIYLKDNCCDYQ